MSFINKGEIKTLSDLQDLKEFITSTTKEFKGSPIEEYDTRCLYGFTHGNKKH